MPPLLLRRDKSSEQDADGRRAIGITVGTIAAVLILLIICCKLRSRGENPDIGAEAGGRHRGRPRRPGGGARLDMLGRPSGNTTEDTRSHSASDITEEPIQRRPPWFIPRRGPAMMDLGRRRRPVAGDARVGALEGLYRRPGLRDGQMSPRRIMRLREPAGIGRPPLRPPLGPLRGRLQRMPPFAGARPNNHHDENDDDDDDDDDDSNGRPLPRLPLRPLRGRLPRNLPPIAGLNPNNHDDEDYDDNGSEYLRPRGGPGVLHKGPSADWPRRDRILLPDDRLFGPRTPSHSESTVDPPPAAHLPRTQRQRPELYRANLAHDYICPPISDSAPSARQSEIEDDVVHFVRRRQEGTPPSLQSARLPADLWGTRPSSPSSAVELAQGRGPGTSCGGLARRRFVQSMSTLGLLLSSDEARRSVEKAQIVDAIPEGGDNEAQAPPVEVAVAGSIIQVVAATPPPDDDTGRQERTSVGRRSLQPYYESVSESIGTR